MKMRKFGSDATGHEDKDDSRANVGVPQFASNEDAAHWWLDFGLRPIPALPGSKHAALKWDPWLESLSHESISQHWAKHPDHQVGIIPGDRVIVLDSDTPQSLAAQREHEQQFGVSPKLIIETSRGVHDYLQLAEGTFAKSDSHDSAAKPAGIDIKTGRAFVMIAPSPGKRVLVCDAVSTDDLSAVGQDFIDAIAQHNGRQPPRPPKAIPRPRATEPVSDAKLRQLSAMLDVLDPDRDYDGWVQGGMAIFHETGGSDDGLALFDSWSSQGSKYRGFREIEDKWKSFSLDQPNPLTIRTLRHRVDAAGHDWIEICAALEAGFEVCAFEVIEQPGHVDHKPKLNNPLAAFSLLGRSEELAKAIRETIPVLEQMAFSGQSTALFAMPNLGKTLIVLHETIEGIQAGRIDPGNVYYVNVDDTYEGILTKLRIAEKHGFHMLAEGLLDFSASKFVGLMVQLIETDQARGVIVILDTLKRFTNLMDKTQASMFTKIVRRFVMKGGTVIALAHTNKNLGRDGKPTYGGTSDIVDDFDCCYVAYPVSTLPSGEKVVEFENIKRRGNVADTVAYRYNPTGRQSYGELLGSVQRVDDTTLAPMKQEAQRSSDEAIVVAVADCIREGINTKKKICSAVMERTAASRRTVYTVMDRYTGHDLDQHHWRYSTGPRGAWVYQLLDDSAPPEPDADDEVPEIDA